MEKDQLAAKMSFQGIPQTYQHRPNDGSQPVNYPEYQNGGNQTVAEDLQGTAIHFHQHQHSVTMPRIGGAIIPSLLLAGVVAATVKTNGEIEEIKWLVPVFAILCFWKNL